MKFYSRLLGGLSLLLISSTAVADDDRKRFLETKKSIQQGQVTEFAPIKNQFEGDVLLPYLEYYFINKNFSGMDAATIRAYFKTYPNTPKGVALQRRWLEKLAKEKNWHLFLADYTQTSHTVTLCYYFQALQNTYQEDKAENQIQAIWLSAKDRPSNCTVVFENWLENKPNKDELVWQRFALALKAYNFNLASYLTDKLSVNKQREANAILKLYDNPNLITKKSFLDNEPSAEVISYGLFRLARRNPYSAIKYWSSLSEQYDFTSEQQQRVFQAIALKLVMRKNSNATKWFKKVVGMPLAPVYKEWMIRAGLIHKDWHLVKSGIEGMSETDKQSSRWQYWYARSLEKLGQKQKAINIYNNLSLKRDYYGFLASAKLNKPIDVQHDELQISQEEMDLVEAMPSFKRAKILYQLNQISESRLELYYLMKQLPMRQQYIVVKLISDMGWHAQVLRLSRISKFKDDITLRFPITFENHVSKHGNNYKLNQALVYAIIRQESYFTEKIHSHAGAVGLMQLMPSTAHKTARRFKLKYNNKQELLSAPTNIKIGCAHLRELHEEFKQQTVLVIAAYNAGKKAVHRWRQQAKRLPADIWIETIPYKETRAYVKKVIAGYVVYQERLNQQPSINSFLKTPK